MLLFLHFGTLLRFGKHKLGSSTIVQIGKTVFAAEFLTVANTLCEWLNNISKIFTGSFPLDSLYNFSKLDFWNSPSPNCHCRHLFHCFLSYVSNCEDIPVCLHFPLMSFFSCGGIVGQL